MTAEETCHVFVGSSLESLSLAYALQENMLHDAELTVWSQGIFELSKPSLASLEDGIDKFDFAVFILSPDDLAKIREDNYKVARDNVVFELGMFIGRLGSERCYVVAPHDVDDLHLPTDLLGITRATYKSHAVHQNDQAKLGPAANKIRERVNKLGRFRFSGLADTNAGPNKVHATSRPIAWIMGSYRELTTAEAQLCKKLAHILGTGMAERGIQAVVGESDMLCDLASAYRSALLPSDPNRALPNAAVLYGRLRGTDMRRVFLNTIGAVPSIAIVLGGGTKRQRVADEVQAASVANIPILAVATTGGAAATVTSTVNIPDDVRKVFEPGGSSLDVYDLATAILNMITSVCA